MTLYTRKQRASIVRALKAVKPMLWDGIGVGPYHAPGADNTETYICDAISQACRDGAITKNERDLVRNLIATRIEWRFSLNRWLVTKGVPPDEITSPRLQAHRRAWVNLLIAEFSPPKAARHT